MKGRHRFRLSLRSRDALLGYLFTMPFLLGFIFLFLYPFIQSIQFSLSELVITGDGYELLWLGLDNYYTALFINADFPRLLVENALAMLRDVPLILIFSFFASMLLNQKFKGRLIARIVFFLPVIMGADIVLTMESADYMSTFLDSSIAVEEEVATSLFSRGQLVSLLMYLKLPEQLLTYIVAGSTQISEIIRASGVQILIFLAGLQGISPSLYEVAKMEGASG